MGTRIHRCREKIEDTSMNINEDNDDNVLVQIAMSSCNRLDGL